MKTNTKTLLILGDSMVKQSAVRNSSRNGQTHKDKMIYLTSTCIHSECLWQISAMSLRGSKAPYTVVPAVALMQNGTKPCHTEAGVSSSRSQWLFFFFFANHQRSPLRKTFTFFLAETMAASSSAEIIFPLKTGNIHTNV